jgi:exonuclease VII small subunit
VVGVKPVSLPIDGFSEDCVTIWETLTMLSGCQPDMSKLQQLEVVVQTLQNTTAAFDNKLQTLETGHSELAELGQLLNFEYDQLQQVVQRLGSGGSSLSSVAMDTLKAQIKLIEARLPSDPFVIGGRTFNSKADVALFVEKVLSGLSFSLFHDPITLLESISDGQTKKSDVMAAMYQASRVGFDEDEATHIHSFKLIVPSLLGATMEGDKNDPKYPLPAVKDFASWNPQDNEGGVKKRLQDGMDDVSLAVTESINVSCADRPAASKLAIEMLYQTQVFINEHCSWVDSFYLELINTSQVPVSEAWLLVASCIRKFCEVLRKFRAPADRAASKMDSSTRTTAYLWSIIQVHREMKNIRSHNFRGHPSVSPAITLHVL